LGTISFVPFYGYQIFESLRKNQSLPLGFAPTASFGVTAWAWIFSPDGKLSYDLALADQLKNLSLLLSAIFCAGIAIMAALKKSRAKVKLTELELCLLSAVFLTTFFAFFYMVNPEYYMIAFVPTVFLATNKKELIAISTIFSLPWATNFFYGLNEYRKFFSVDPLVFRNALIFIDSFLTLGVVIWLLMRLFSTSHSLEHTR
jgi:hypothetical protein